MFKYRWWVRIQAGMCPCTFSRQQSWGMRVERHTLGILGVRWQSTKPALGSTQSIPTGSHVALAWVRPALGFCPSAPFLVSPTNEMVSSCWTHESAVGLSGSSSGEGWEGEVCPTSFFFLCVWMFNLRDTLPQWPELRQLLEMSEKSRKAKQ